VSEQIIDLRSVWANLRRHAGVLGVAAAVGALAGGGALRLLPAEYSSTSIVLIPATSTGASAGPNSHTIDTQVQIALSDAVLGPAGESLTPRLDTTQVGNRVEVEAPTTEVLVITAHGPTAEDAEALAKAIATADVAYLQEAASALTKDQRAALAKRRATLEDSLGSVQTEVDKTSKRLSKESPTSAAGKADAAALAQLTARQADLVLNINDVDRQLAGGNQMAGSQTSGSPRVVQSASPGASLPPVLRGAIFVGTGAATAFFAVAALVVLRGRKEKTLRSRDQIADSIGVPVVASVQSRTPRSVTGWANILESYAPDISEAWSLRQLLQRLVPRTSENHAGPVRTNGRRIRPVEEDGPRSNRVIVLSISGDQPALSFGPQLASFAAGTGIQTQLVVTPQPHESTNSLRAACARIGADELPRPGLSVESRPDVRYFADLVVYVVPVDRHRPDPYLFGADGAVTLLAVSSGGATAEDLAAVALGADDAGLPLVGIVVADPDPLDHTTGRLLPSERALLAPMPSLMTGPSGPGEPTAPVARGRQR
jgi:hypothetical protein